MSEPTKREQELEALMIRLVQSMDLSPLDIIQMRICDCDHCSAMLDVIIAVGPKMKDLPPAGAVLN